MEVRMIRTQWILIGTVGLALVAVGWDTLQSFINLPSLAITLGGTLAATCFSYSWETLRELGVVIHVVLTSRSSSPQEQLATIVQLAHLNHLGGLRALESREPNLHDPLLQHAVSMIVDMRREDDIQSAIEQEFFLFAHRYEAARQVLLTIGKLLPSFGMVGTLIGLVLLLRQATDPDPQALAPALAVAVLTTLYGAVFSNALVLPLATKLQAFIQDREMIMRLTLEGMVLVARSQPPAVIQKRLATLIISFGGADANGQQAVPQTRSLLAFLHR
jgi:chemotaxis protein MotA